MTSSTTKTVGLLALASLLLFPACSNPKKKAEKVFKRALAQCQTADGTFAQIDVLSGDETRDVLRVACDTEIKDITMEKKHAATTTVGPYTWEAGIDERTDIWTMKGISWETLDQARKRLEKEDPGVNSLKRTVELLTKAQEEFPKSGWIRLRRLETMIELHDEQLGGDKKPVDIGDEAEEYLGKTISWAEENDHPAVKAEALVYVSNYIKDYIDLMKKSKENLGNQDEYFKKSIEVAEKEGDEEEAEKYRKELEEMRKKRPELRKKYQEFVEDAQQKLCDRLEELSADNVEDESLVQKIKGVQTGVDCKKIREQAAEGDGDSGQEEEE